MIELDGKRVLVVGLGQSGAAAAEASARLGASVDLVDNSVSPSKAGALATLKKAGVQVGLGIEVPDDMHQFDLVVMSPGVPDRAPVTVAARKAGVKVISELELGYRLLEGRTMVAVTGTNGKTTTTILIGEILKEGGQGTITCGNIGNPLTGAYGKAGPSDVLVVEVSSFQLRNIDEFHARVAVALNVAPDHFDWHADFRDYRDAKLRLVENMLPQEFLVYNLEDEACVEMASRARGVTLGFASSKRAASAVWVEKEWIVSGPPLQPGRVLPVGEIRLAGGHNVQNIMAATGAALALGCKPAGIRETVSRFEGLEHRMEFVADVKGVAFYNDSKATNPHASLHSMKAFDQPMVAIMGGRNKGLDFSEVADEICRRMRNGIMRGLVLFGESYPEIRDAVRKVCRDSANGHIVVASNLRQSVQKAFTMAEGEGVVILTPACASFDMFVDYKDRGRVFKESVAALQEGVIDADR
jgi:UDP-N-acetylmuramoylalanine--D-glutamate ligase